MKETTERKMNKRLLAAILFPALILAASLGIKISAAAEADGGVSAAVTHSKRPCRMCMYRYLRGQGKCKLSLMPPYAGEMPRKNSRPSDAFSYRAWDCCSFIKYSAVGFVSCQTSVPLREKGRRELSVCRSPFC